MNAVRRTARPAAPGFTVLDLLLALIVLGVVLAVGLPGVAASIRRSQLDRAAAVVAMDLELALSLAARQREPVRITHNADSKSYAFMNRDDGTVLHQRTLGEQSEYRMAAVYFSPATVDILPTQVTSSPLVVTIQSGGRSRTVTMSSAGQIRVTAS